MPVPDGFVQAVREARHDAGRLRLLAREARGFDWETQGVALAHQAIHCERVILFTGHMVDAPGRATPRFPNAQAPLAAAAIEAQLNAILKGGAANSLGIAGGASGGDILFHEACARIGMPTRLHLSLPMDLFVAKSVTFSAGDWERRFHAVEQKASTAVLGESEELPAWLAAKEGYSVWVRTNLWMLEEALSLAAPEVHLIALWNLEGGDGIGGTGHFVQFARQEGILTHVIDTKQLFGL